jgi:copper chaperone CopZ
MTCTGCQSKVQELLSKVDGVKNVTADLAKGTADIEMSQHISTTTLKAAFQNYPKYRLSETLKMPVVSDNSFKEEKK